MDAKMQGILKWFGERERRPRLPFLFLTILQLMLGVVVLFLGLSAFLTTPQYRVGGFWAGLIVGDQQYSSIPYLCD